MSRVESEDEVLPAGPRLPRRLLWLAATALVLVALVAVVSTLKSDRPSALPTGSGHPPTGPPTRGLATSAPPPAPIALGPALTLPSRALPVDIAVVGDQAWLLQDDRLSTFTTDAEYRSRSVPGLSSSSGGQRPRVLVDSSAGRVWVVMYDVAGSTIRAYDSSTLTPEYARNEPAAVYSAAPLDGALVFSDAAGVFRLRPTGPPRAVPGAGAYGELTADPSHARVLSLQPATHAVLETIDAFGPARRVVVKQSIASGTLAVTGSGQLWLGGYGDAGAVLARLDPFTFAATERSPISFEAGSGVQIIASGSDDLLVETGEVPGQLTCMSGTDGAALQSWPIFTEAAALTHQTGYALLGAGVVPLELHGGCTG